jgi:aspartyl-tRNA(Asn)/glutamyl-tRNA(Gln) amidotransferase subunit C
MLGQLNGFFRIVEQMSAVDTAASSRCTRRCRPCSRCSCACATTWSPSADNRSANQRSAPAVEDGLFLVPKVIE